MRKKLLIALVLSVLMSFALATSTAFACQKDVVSIDDSTYGDGDGRWEVGERLVIQMRIGISAYLGDDWFNVMVYDRINAELDIVSIDSIIMGEDGMSIPNPEMYVTYYHQGKNGKGATYLEWTVGDLPEGERAQLFFTCETNFNPAGKQRYTSPDTYELNSGPTLKCNVGSPDGPRYSESPPTFGMPDPITIVWPD